MIGWSELMMKKIHRMSKNDKDTGAPPALEATR